MLNETEYGFEFTEGSFLIFFGKKDCALDQVQKLYPDIQLRQIRQTHSSIVIPSQLHSDHIEADAHFTNETNVGLVVRTADCLPIMMYSASQNFIAAIHAGWRGVENQITLETLKRLPKASDLKVIIGPHILQASFEVQEDVKNLLVKSLENVADRKGDRYCVDLQKIVESQIHSLVPQAHIQKSSLNTYKNPQFNSFRTDQTRQRNISFIVQKTSPV